VNSAKAGSSRQHNLFCGYVYSGRTDRGAGCGGRLSGDPREAAKSKK